MSTQNQYAVFAAIDGGPISIWDGFEGGGVDSEETRYKPGAMQPEISLGGTRTVENITLTRLYDLDRDHLVVKQWMAKCGRATVIIAKQPLDADGNVKGSSLVYTGKLKMVKPPDHDSNSSEAATIQIEVTPAGTVA